MHTSHTRIVELENELAQLKEQLERFRKTANEVEDTRESIQTIFDDMNNVLSRREESNKMWELTFDAISDPIFIIDNEFKIIKANSAYAEAAGMSFKEIIGQPYFKVFPKMDGPCSECLKVKESGKEENGDIFISLTSKYYKVKSFPAVYKDSNVIYSIHILEDITEQKKAEALILDSESKYRHLFDNLNDAVLLADCENGRIIDTNHQGEVLLNRRRDEIIGMHQSEIHPPDKKEEYRQRFEDHHTQGRMADYDGEIIRSDGRIIPVRISASPITINEKKMMIGMFRDITERKEALDRLKKEADANRALLEVVESISTIRDKDEIIRRIVGVASKVVDAEMISVFLWDREVNAFVLAHLWKTEIAVKDYSLRFKFTPDMPMAEKILNGEIILIADVMDSHIYPRERAQILSVRSVLYIPIICNREILGFIGAERSGTPRPFGNREVQFLQGVTHQMSVSLDNLRLYREMIDKTIELSQRAETLRVMNDIDKRILSSLDSQEILEGVIQLVSTLIPSDRATVTLIDKERNGFIYKAGFGVRAAKGTFVPFEDTSCTDVVIKGIPQIITDLTLEAELLPVEEILREEGYRSHIRIPLFVKGEVIGSVNVGSKSAAHFTQQHLTTLEKVGSQISLALENTRLLSDLKELLMGIVRSLSATIDAKSPWTSGHSERVTKYAISIASEIGINQKGIKDIELAGLLHDIGKIGTNDIILNKPGKLTEDELKIMQQHPVKGATILAPIKHLQDIIPAVRHHHEFYDGRGYPDGLTGETIPLMARVLTVADTVDAMSADRPYRNGMTMNVIIEELKRCSGSQFDPIVVDAFINISTQVAA